MGGTGEYVTQGTDQRQQLVTGNTVASSWASTVPSWPHGRRRTPRWMRRYVAIVLLLDVLAALVAASLAYGVRFLAPEVPASSYWSSIAVLPVLWVVLVHLCSGYEVLELTSGDGEYRHVVHAGLWATSLVAFVSYALALEIARGFVLVAIPSVVFASLVSRYVARKGVHRLRSRGRCMKSVVAVGREGAVLELVRQTQRDQFLGMTVVAACVPDPSRAHLLRECGVEVRGSLDEAAAVVCALDADAVAVTSSSETAAQYLRKLSWELEGSGVELLVAPGLMEVAGPRMHIRPFVGLPLLHVAEPEFTGAKRIVKGAVDRVLAGAALFVVAPLLIAIAIAVKVGSRGPVFFRQTRIGRGGVEFTMIKFRTMVVDAEQARLRLLDANTNADGLLFKIQDDPRITRVGRLLRRYSVDEIPQLVNVLFGQMSLVGPRPPLPGEVALYDDSVRRRLLVKPGLTGLWQVSGRSDLTWEESVRLDLRYVENWSLPLDVMILWKTASAVLRARGAY